MVSAELGLDRFGQDAAQFNELAAALERIAEAGGTRSELRDLAVRQAAAQVVALPSPLIATPRIDDLARRVSDYAGHVQVPEVIEVYRAIRQLAVVTRDTAGVIERCEVHERNWLDQLGHDLGRGWDKAWHAVFESERSDEVNREHDRLAAEVRAASVERAGALDRWRAAVGETCGVIARATSALAARSPECPPELCPTRLLLGESVAAYVTAGWLERSALPTYERLKADPDQLADIPGWFLQYRYQLTQVTLPADEGVAFLGALSGGLAQMATEVGIPLDTLLACNRGDGVACAKVAVSLGMAFPAGGRRGGYVQAPKKLKAFPNARWATYKTPVQGGGGLRKRWKDPDGTIYEWDSQHGTVEKYNKKGRHLGEFDPDTGEMTKPADPKRRVEP